VKEIQRGPAWRGLTKVAKEGNARRSRVRLFWPNNGDKPNDRYSETGLQRERLAARSDLVLATRLTEQRIVTIHVA
jgi:hypothetical protein